jgi:hypothetical protein
VTCLKALSAFGHSSSHCDNQQSKLVSTHTSRNLSNLRLIFDHFEFAHSRGRAGINIMARFLCAQPALSQRAHVESAVALLENIDTWLVCVCARGSKYHTPRPAGQVVLCWLDLQLSRDEEIAVYNMHAWLFCCGNGVLRGGREGSAIRAHSHGARSGILHTSTLDIARNAPVREFKYTQVDLLCLIRVRDAAASHSVIN